jgi:hypothetical protein
VTQTLLLALMVALQTAPAPLFDRDEPLTLTLTADFTALRRDRRGGPEERPATLVWTRGDADSVALAVQLRPRGDFRLDPTNCSFPPLRINFRSKAAEGTVFEGQDKLKLVVPCKPNLTVYEQYVLREYLLYRVYGLVTDRSFDVRLARITFRDSSGGDEPFTRFGFFIESDTALAARLHAQLMDIPEGKIIRAQMLRPEASTTVAVFEYMIGNTDWADAEIHNVATLLTDGRVEPIPYDFDFSGAVETPYATPAPGLPIKTVRQRYYRGWCWPGQDVAPILERFRSARPRIQDLYRTFPWLDDHVRDETLTYFGSFFESIDTPQHARRRFMRDCRVLPPDGR